MKRLTAAICFLLVLAVPGQTQTLRPSRMVVTVGLGYDRGDFGTPDVSKAMYVPFSLRYVANRFDWTVSSSIARIDTAGGVRLIDGVPTLTSSANGPLNETGMGDTVLRSRFFLAEDGG